MNTLCKRCGKRRARRYCPGVSDEICPVCCGTERENTIDCPSDCVFLQEARRHEKPVELKPAGIPNQDIRLGDDFIQDNEQTIVWLTMAMVQSMEKERAVDFDTREALESLIRTYRTLESGLIYETRPQNPYAAAVQQAIQDSVDELRKHLTQERGMATLRDSEVLGALVFLQRLELQHNNGRKRGRAFFDFLRASFVPPPAATTVVP